MSDDNISKRTRSSTRVKPTYRTASESDISNIPEGNTSNASVSSDEKNENDNAVSIMSTSHDKAHYSQMNILEEKVNFLESENRKLKVRVSQFKRNNNNLHEKFSMELENNKELTEKLAIQEGLTSNLIRIVYNLRAKMSNK